MIRISDHAEIAIEKLPTQFRELPNWRGLVTALIGKEAMERGLQGLEDDLEGFYDRLDIENCNSTWELIQIGKLVGRSKNTSSLTLLKRYIYAQIAANSSHGSADNLYHIFQLLCEPTAKRLRDLPPAAVLLQGIGCDVIPTDARSQLQKSASAGVQVFVTATTLTNPFVFAGVNEAIGKGFSSLANPTIGGQLAALI